MKEEKIALSLGAHPDDAEFLYAGTLALLKEAGWQIHIATMTAGDGGSKEHPPEEISSIRRNEAAKAAEILEARYTCLESRDAFVLYDEPTIRKVIGLVREIRPTVIFTLSPECYMIDHIMTANLAMTGAFCCGVPNIQVPGVEAFEPVPYLYYADPIEGKDRYGIEVKPTMIIDVSSVTETKKEMLLCHASQRDWLMKHHGMDEYVEAMESGQKARGSTINVQAGEGFRQHLGHAFPQDNILKKELGDLVRVL